MIVEVTIRVSPATRTEVHFSGEGLVFDLRLEITKSIIA